MVRSFFRWGLCASVGGGAIRPGPVVVGGGIATVPHRSTLWTLQLAVTTLFTRCDTVVDGRRERPGLLLARGVFAGGGPRCSRRQRRWRASRRRSRPAPTGALPTPANDRTGGEWGATLERSDLAERPRPSLVGGRLRLTQGGCTPLTPAEPARSFLCKLRSVLTFDAPIAHHTRAPTAHTLHRHLTHEDR